MELELAFLMRGVLTLVAFCALLLSGAFFGAIWPERSWPIRVICVGLFVVLVYVVVGQFKAFNLGIPFDWVSLIGLGGYLILLAGFAWFVIPNPRTRRDR